MKSMKHIKCKEKLEANIARERSIVEALKMYNEKHHLRGEILPDSQQVYHVQVVTCFLKVAVHLHKLDCFHELPEKHAYQLTDRHHLSTFIRSEEESKI